MQVLQAPGWRSTGQSEQSVLLEMPFASREAAHCCLFPGEWLVENPVSCFWFSLCFGLFVFFFQLLFFKTSGLGFVVVLFVCFFFFKQRSDLRMGQHVGNI